MKLRHNTNGYVPDRTDPEWADRVEREAHLHTARSIKRHEQAQRRQARATERAQREQSRRRSNPQRVAKLWALVELRRDELNRLARLMNATPAGSKNRGTGSYKGVA